MTSQFEYERVRIDIERLRIRSSHPLGEPALRLPASMVDEMIDHALFEAPIACCGIIAGRDGTATRLFRTRNEDNSPYRYHVHQLDLIQTERELDQNDWMVLGIYSSRPDARPSATDIRLAKFPFSEPNEPPLELYPGTAYIFVSIQMPSSPVVRAYRLNLPADRMDEIGLEVEGSSRYMLRTL